MCEVRRRAARKSRYRQLTTPSPPKGPAPVGERPRPVPKAAPELGDAERPNPVPAPPRVVGAKPWPADGSGEKDLFVPKALLLNPPPKPPPVVG